MMTICSGNYEYIQLMVMIVYKKLSGSKFMVHMQKYYAGILLIITKIYYINEIILKYYIKCVMLKKRKLGGFEFEFIQTQTAKRYLSTQYFRQSRNAYGHTCDHFGQHDHLNALSGSR